MESRATVTVQSLGVSERAQGDGLPVIAIGGQPLVLSVRQAAAALGVSKGLVYELIARGELPALRLGRRVVVPTKALLAFVDGVDER